MSKPVPDLRSVPPEHLLLFDGVCNLCNGFVRFIIRHDKRQWFRFAPLQGETSQRILSTHGFASGTLDSLVYVRNGKALVRSAAALNVARDLGGPWVLLYPFMLVPRFIRDALYDLVARNRYRWFGKRPTCMVPTPELLERFLN
ncbi:MAG: thiol-disulfide oxidoreductase DCC family protein [Flavobacteriales bacterium]